MKITTFGQLSVGDKVKIVGKSKRDCYKSITVKDVLNPNTKKEEIIINKSKNYFFITNMLVKGTSWAKEVTKITSEVEK